MANKTSSIKPSPRVDPAVDPAARAPRDHASQEPAPDDDEEFKITVKKLDRVVRPRGVLAE